MTAAPLPPCPPLTTNIDAWHAIRSDLANGYTIGAIATRHQLSYQMVGNWARMTKPPRRKIIGRHHRSPRHCTDCNTIVSYSARRGNPRCAACDTRQRGTTAAQARADLREWSNTHNAIPTIRQAQAITGYSRSHAAAIINDTFGDYRTRRARIASPPIG